MLNDRQSVSPGDASECIVGWQACEERGNSGGDSDDVWFCYHPLCYEQFLESVPSWSIELYRSIRREEALKEEYVCEVCEQLLVA